MQTSSREALFTSAWEVALYTISSSVTGKVWIKQLMTLSIHSEKWKSRKVEKYKIVGEGGETGPRDPPLGPPLSTMQKYFQRGFFWIVSPTEFRPWTQKYIYV